MTHPQSGSSSTVTALNLNLEILGFVEGGVFLVVHMVSVIGGRRMLLPLHHPCSEEDEIVVITQCFLPREKDS